MNGPQSIVLPPLSTLYAAITRARLTAYRRKWFSTAKLAAPVISVGNLTTGGTGKTPLVEYVCRVLERNSVSNRRTRVCVLTRGYKRPNAGSQVVVSDGKRLLADAPEAGDEPFLLAKNLLGVAAVICNRDRFAAGNWAIANLDSEAFVLDDGFQHLQLERDLDVVTIDATNPWSNQSLLPYGRLREPLSSLARARCFVITRSDQIEDTTAIKQVIERFAPNKPIFTSRMVTAAIKTIAGETVDSLPGHFGAFCGVGNPESFFAQLRRQGLEPAFTKSFPDHHNYTQTDLDRLAKEAENHKAECLLTTAKDAVKLSALALNLPCFSLEIKIVIDDEERFSELLTQVQISNHKVRFGFEI
jgi:tetraacyldisaccharide 4'-kinase